VELVGRTINFPSSYEENRVVVNGGVDEFLDSLKLTYESLPELLGQLCQHELTRREYLPALRLVLLSQAGFHFAVPQPIGPEIQRELLLDGWRHCLTDTQYTYFKTAVTDDLDNRVGS
jgi:hypothetical protein